MREGSRRCGGASGGQGVPQWRGAAAQAAACVDAEWGKQGQTCVDAEWGKQALPAGPRPMPAHLQQAKLRGDEGVALRQVQLWQRRALPPLLARGGVGERAGAGEPGAGAPSLRACRPPAGCVRRHPQALAAAPAPLPVPGTHLQPVLRQRPRRELGAIPLLRVGAVGLRASCGRQCGGVRADHTSCHQKNVPESDASPTHLSPPSHTHPPTQTTSSVLHPHILLHTLPPTCPPTHPVHPATLPPPTSRVLLAHSTRALSGVKSATTCGRAGVEAGAGACVRVRAGDARRRLGRRVTWVGCKVH